jgi:hypothetical protein
LALGTEQLSDVDEGRWLIEHRGEMDRGEARWLARLAQFDRDQLWALDGQLSCATWLVWRTNMARSTAFEKLRVAHELQRRPIVAEAFRDGRLSYSAARAISRMDRPDPEVDAALVELAESGRASIIDVERAVRAYSLYADQERPPDREVGAGRDVRILRGHDGIGQVVVSLSDLELEEFAATLQAFIDLRYRPVRAVENGGDESSGEDRGGEAPAALAAPAERPGRSEQKADAFMDLARIALAHADGGQAAGDDRYLVHVVTRHDGQAVSLVNGSPLPPADGAMIACDAGRVAHTVGDGGEPLHLGRKTRDWSTAQRRAILVRDRGQCRFVGCGFAHYDIHHLRPWEAGGGTDIDNGFAACPRHHHKLHAGFRVEGDPNGELLFYRPDGSYLGSTHPGTARVTLAPALGAC